MFLIENRLKSDQNGIEMNVQVDRGTYSNGLKSDQNGIEIRLQDKNAKTPSMLKSDQNGIEIISPGLQGSPLQVKIRPKWD